ncbi:MAG: hypothetical protein H6709_17790 [Kofleriaceae bacterium]|nr:hypothetical protein [Kofleriaceae bacterium]
MVATRGARVGVGVRTGGRTGTGVGVRASVGVGGGTVTTASGRAEAGLAASRVVGGGAAAGQDGPLLADRVGVDDADRRHRRRRGRRGRGRHVLEVGGADALVVDHQLHGRGQRIDAVTADPGHVAVGGARGVGLDRGAQRDDAGTRRGRAAPRGAGRGAGGGDGGDAGGRDGQPVRRPARRRRLAGRPIVALDHAHQLATEVGGHADDAGRTVAGRRRRRGGAGQARRRRLLVDELGQQIAQLA